LGIISIRTALHRQLICTFRWKNSPGMPSSLLPENITRRYGKAISSREHATEVIKILGIKYIVCQSMARIYFRNCIATGVYPVICKDAGRIFNEGDEIEIDLTGGTVKNPGTGIAAVFQPIPDTLLPILEAGGILELLKKR
jgi:3-isopropylmalate dehydratase small subunit